MKIKGFTGLKNFDKKVYRFKNGICILEGVWYKKKPMTITFREFRELTR